MADETPTEPVRPAPPAEEPAPAAAPAESPPPPPPPAAAPPPGPAPGAPPPPPAGPWAGRGPWGRPRSRWLPALLIGLAGLLVGCVLGGAVGLVVGHAAARPGPGFSRMHHGPAFRGPGMGPRNGPGFGPRQRVPGPAGPANPVPSPSRS